MTSYEEPQEEIEIEAIGIEIDSQPIELYKLFKLANLVNGGGEAKHIISEGYVAVNGEIETRKRRKMYDGDLVEFNREFYLVICDTPEGELPEVFADDLTDDEYLVSDEEKARLDTEVDEPSVPESEFSPEPQEESPQDDTAAAPADKPSEPAKRKGRKSIQFF